MENIGICFNREPPRRGENLVTRKIPLSLANIISGKQNTLRMGNIDSLRDWGYAKDYVQGMWAALQYNTPEDYIFATGQQYDVRSFIQEAFGLCGYNIEWRGSGLDEVGVDKASERILVEIDPVYYRPAEVDALIGNFDKAKRELNWEPKTSLKELVYIMVESDLRKNNLDPKKYLKSK